MRFVVLTHDTDVSMPVVHGVFATKEDAIAWASRWRAAHVNGLTLVRKLHETEE